MSHHLFLHAKERNKAKHFHSFRLTLNSLPLNLSLYSMCKVRIANLVLYRKCKVRIVNLVLYRKCKVRIVDGKQRDDCVVIYTSREYSSYASNRRLVFHHKSQRFMH